MQSIKNPCPNINLKTTSTREIENIIKSLKPKNSSGYDGISTKLMKICPPFISSPSAHIYNKFFSTGIFPNYLKYAIVKPLFKKGNKNKISNYRPISILIYFPKILDKVTYNHLQEHLNKQGILAEEQFGFRADSTTNKTIYKLINETLNSKLIVGGIFFDLEKAFDCLKHGILLSKLQFYGVNGKANT